MVYNGATGCSLPGNVGTGVYFSLEVAASAFSCLKSLSLPVWQGWSGHSLKTWGMVGWRVYLCRRQLFETFEEEQVGLQLSVGTVLLRLSCQRRNILKTGSLASGFKPVNCSKLFNRLCTEFTFVFLAYRRLSPMVWSCWDLVLALFHFARIVELHHCLLLLSLSLYKQLVLWLSLYFGPTFPSLSTIFARRISSN